MDAGRAFRLAGFALAWFEVMTAFPMAAQERTLTVTFEQDTVTVGGATPGESVVIFGIGIGSHGLSSLLTRHVEALADDDRDGKVTCTARQVPKRSVWVAVDLQSGAYVVATPSGEVPSPLAVPDEQWQGNRTHFEVRRAYAEFLVVRPRVGAWSLRMSEGGSRDDDKQVNGVSRLRLENMNRVIGTEKGPPFATAKDLIFVVDPQTLDFLASEAR